MKVFTKIVDLQAALSCDRKQEAKIGFVPTMGALHAGHASLVERSVKDNDVTVVSIFLNPTQFNDKSDLEHYPQTFEADCEMLENVGADYVFAPSVSEIYPTPDTRVFDFPPVTTVMEGAKRPGHFNGVCQVVSRLFDIVQPDYAYFGEKDAQQLAIIRKMVFDLNFPVHIIGVPIVRESDGLAKSSRNTYLSSEERKAATILYKAIQEGKQAIKCGVSADTIINTMTNIVDTEPLAKIDYISVVDANTMQPVQEITSPVLVAMAVYIGSTRLIDNFSFDTK